MLRSVVFGLVALVVFGTLVQTLLSWRDAQALPMRGRLVDAGGMRLRILESGAGQPGPTVVLECGIGGATAASWGWVQRGVERFAPVVSYDRAGLGWSDPGPLPRNGRRLVGELHQLLINSGHRPPYVFVGHSYGGLLARLFVDAYPDEVAGVVLLDSSHPRQFGETHRTPAPLRLIRTLLPAAPWAARLGVMRLAVRVVPMDVKLLPPRERAEQMAFLGSARHWEGTVREMRAWMPLTNDEAAATHGFGDRPLAVITADHGAGWGGWMRLQDSIASLSTRSVHEMIPGSTHGGLLSDSSCAARAVAAIHAVRDAAVNGGALKLPPAH